MKNACLTEKKTNKKKNKLRTIEPYQPAIWEHTEFGKRIDVAEVGTEPDFPRSSPGWREEHKTNSFKVAYTSLDQPKTGLYYSILAYSSLH